MKNILLASTLLVSTGCVSKSHLETVPVNDGIFTVIKTEVMGYQQFT
jgi:hypothetical protein